MVNTKEDPVVKFNAGPPLPSEEEVSEQWLSDEEEDRLAVLGDQESPKESASLFDEPKFSESGPKETEFVVDVPQETVVPMPEEPVQPVITKKSNKPRQSSKSTKPPRRDVKAWGKSMREGTHPNHFKDELHGKD